MSYFEYLSKGFVKDEPSLKTSITITGVLPAVYIVLVLISDYLEPIGTITPFFTVLGIMVMALCFKPVHMIPWSILFTTIVCCIFLVPKFHLIFTGKPITDQPTIPLVRAATYVLVCIAACYLCIILNRLRRIRFEYADMLEKLPWPILTSNHNGNILYANEAAKFLIPELNVLTGNRSFFDLLAPKHHQGKIIANYLHRLENGPNNDALELEVQGTPVKGFTKKLNWIGETVLLTVLTQESFQGGLINREGFYKEHEKAG